MVFALIFAAPQLLNSKAFDLLGENVSAVQDSFRYLYDSARRDRLVFVIALADLRANLQLVFVGKLICVHILFKRIVVIFRGPAVRLPKPSGNQKPKPFLFLVRKHFIFFATLLLTVYHMRPFNLHESSFEALVKAPPLLICRSDTVLAGVFLL